MWNALGTEHTPTYRMLKCSLLWIPSDLMILLVISNKTDLLAQITVEEPCALINWDTVHMDINYISYIHLHMNTDFQS